MATNDLTIQPTFAKPASPIDLTPNQTITVVIGDDRLFEYNEGTIGPGDCED